MNRRAQNALLVFLSLSLTGIALELVVRFFHLAPPTPKVLYDASNRIVKFLPNQTGVISFGKRGQKQVKYRINNEGWNSAADYDSTDTRPLIAVIGDSYIQAMQVGVRESYPAVMQQKLGEKYRVYSFGFSGATLCQYVSMSRYVRKRFKPKVLILNLVHNDFDESLCHLKGNGMGFMCVDTATYQTRYLDFSAPKTLQSRSLHKILYSSALARYLSIYGNVTKRRTSQIRYNQNTDPAKLKSVQREIGKVTEILLNAVKTENPETPILLVMDGLRGDIYNNTLPVSDLAWLNDLVRQKAEAQKLTLIDLTTPFLADFRQHKRHFESETDFHWNEYGHRKVAEVILEKLVQNGIVEK
ncbi:MAG: GDSL-type esterase/lipase family protein [Spirosomataceae bacterium]